MPSIFIGIKFKLLKLILLNYMMLKKGEIFMDIKVEEKEGKSSKVIGTYVTGEMFQALQNEAEEEFMSISNLVRKILYLHIKDKEAEQGKLLNSKREEDIKNG